MCNRTNSTKSRRQAGIPPRVVLTGEPGEHYARYGKRYKDDQRVLGLCVNGDRRPRHWSHKSLCLVCSTNQGRFSHGVGFDRKMVMYENQGGACLICGVYEPDPTDLHVDHDHNTKEVRGLLCTRCNPGIGFFQDNPALLMKAARYLQKGN